MTEYTDLYLNPAPVIVFPMLAGGTTVVAAVVVFRLWVALLPRTICHACRDTTLTVGHVLAGGVDRWLKRRWCARCGWHGWGRNGPVLWKRRGPVADGSGFRWGEDRLQPDFGFRWADDDADDASPSSAAHHPSGFRFRETEGEGEIGDGTGAGAETEDGIVAHPSGFRFRSDEAEATPPPAQKPGNHPSGFRWRSGPEKNGFRWKG